MNGLPVAFYTYKGTQTGHNDPWQKPPPPKQPRPTPTPKPQQPCGTHAAYKRHRSHGEPIDEQCRKAKQQYDRDRYHKLKPPPKPRGRPPLTPQQTEQAKQRRREYDRERYRRKKEQEGTA